jgi:LETM1 and EF-hand domain-containing protein 1, mitochondrial
VRFHAPAKRGPNESATKYYGKMAWEVMRHMYHGFRLFYLNTKLAWRYSKQMRNGVALTRRERQLLESATMDLLRLVPFSFFIIVPFGELLLPVALKMFPGLIPSTFETEAQGKNRAYQSAMKTLVARQRLSEYMTTTLVASAKDHSDVLRRVVGSDSLDKKQIKSIAHLCGREGPLGVNRLPPQVLRALARTTGVYQAWYSILPYSITAPKMRSAIIAHYTKLKRDDLALSQEGLDDLTLDELIKANQVRGMRWVEDKETLRVQLQWWVSLAKDPRVPYNTLFWLKPTRYSLRQTMKGLPVDQRRQLLGIQHLPENVRGSLEKLCDNVKGNNKIDEEEEDADTIAQRVEDTQTAAASSGDRLAVQNAHKLLGEYLRADNVKRIFEEIRLEKPPSKPVTVADVTDHLGPDVGISTHVVSNIFDAFDLGGGKSEVTEEALVSIGARCLAESKRQKKEVPASPAPPQPSAPAAPSTATPLK